MSNQEATTEMMWGWSGYGYNWYGGIAGVVLMLLVLGGLAALVVWAVASFAGRRSEADPAEAILRRRLAAGEITEQQYEHLREVLQGRS